MAEAKRARLKQYFTDATQVSAVMSDLLGNTDSLRLLEPSAGAGALLSVIKGKPASVDAVDVDPDALAQIRANPALNGVTVHQADFLRLFSGDMLQGTVPLSREYDCVIANPPYGLHLSQEFRKALKRKYPHLYVRESYGLFLVFAVSSLRSGGRYVFLVPDTFLASRNHTSLRRFIVEHGRPDHVVTFPSRLFESVSFGYGRLCIISGTKDRVPPDAQIKWTEVVPGEASILSSMASDTFVVNGKDLIEACETGWTFKSTSSFDTDGWTTLGALAECKTGIYSGDNERFLGFVPSLSSRKMNGHAIDANSDICYRQLTPAEMRDGISEPPYYVPLVRGGHRDFNEKPGWGIRWDHQSVVHYRTDKKARLQNSSFYFRRGLAVPMVTSRRLSASLMNDAVFDQGVVGVFPKDDTNRCALLLFLNSTRASILRKLVVGESANNSANYLKRLPVPAFSEEHRGEADKIVKVALGLGTLTTSVCDRFVDWVTTSDKPSDCLAAA